MLEEYGGRLDTFQRVLGMTLASLPFWLIVAAYGWWSDGLPTAGQTVQSFIVPVSSGIIATVLFFWATDMVRDNPQKLAAVEATQSGEVIFALLGEIVLLSGVFPSLLSFAGLFIIIAGMVLHTFASLAEKTEKENTVKSDRIASAGEWVKACSPLFLLPKAICFTLYLNIGSAYLY